MNKQTFVINIILLYASSALANFGPARASVAVGHDAAEYCPANLATGTTQSTTSSPLAKLHAKKSSENKLIPWPSIIANLLPLKFISSKILRHDSTVKSVDWNHAGTHLATGSRDKTARICDANTGQQLHTLQHQDWVETVAWNPAGTRLATGSHDKTVRIWDANTGQQLHTLQHQNWVVTVAWNPAGTRLATGSSDGTARICDANTGQQLHTLQHRGGVVTVAWNPAGTHLATGSDDNTARIWNVSTGQQLHTLQHQDWVYTVAWNSAGTHLATGSKDNTACIWDASTGQKLRTLQHQYWVQTVAWNPAGTRLATGSSDNTACIWNASTGQQLHTLQHQDWVYTVAWNPAGTHLATGSRDKTACIWDASTGQKLHTLQHQYWVRTVAWNPAGTHLATGSHDNTARIWDTAHLADPKYHAEHDQLKAGTIAPEQLMLVYLLHQFQQQQKNDKEVSLKAIAQHTQTPGISTAELARVLSTFHPVIRDGMLAHYNISVARENGEKEFAFKAWQETMMGIIARDEIIRKTQAQENQNDIPLPIPSFVTTVLKDYIVHTENYLDSCKALQETQQVVPLLKPVNQILEEYIVDEHPIIEQANGTRHE